MDAGQYQSVIQTSLDQGINLIEAGQEGGDKALINALQSARLQGPITVTFRIGYHAVVPTEDKLPPEGFPGDVAVEKHPFWGSHPAMKLGELSPEANNGNDAMIQVLHNITGAFIRKEVKESPLVQQYQTSKSLEEGGVMRVVALLHNPEAQIMALDTEHGIDQVSSEDRQMFLRDRLVEAFVTLEQAVQEKAITRYGVASNGLCLPREHPLALAADTILEAAKLATTEGDSRTCHLSVLQLPINMMERNGLGVAKELHDKIQGEEQYQLFTDSPPLEIYAMRPLTCYPDMGTGTGHAFRLLDYLLPSGPKEELAQDVGETFSGDQEIPDEELASTQWSNLMSGPPIIYSMALKKAMSHFDAEFLLEESLKRDLSAEERETLDGCKLLQSMLRDLDQGLAQVRSLGAHEQDLYQRIIPLIHNTFEEYDEDTANVLHLFFRSYSLAVRYSISKNTRALLREGGDDGKGVKYEGIPKDEKLQDFALKHLLKEKAIDRVIVGATHPNQVVQMVRVSQGMESMLEEATD